jgi:hypothetical protein
MNIEELQNYIIANHRNMTCREMGRHLNIDYQTIRYQANKIGIKFSRYYDNSKIEQWENITTPEIAYIFGFLWADGSIRYSQHKASGVSIELQREDADHLEKIYKGCGIKYKIYHRNRKNRKPQKNLIINDVKLTNLLINKYSFDQKSKIFFDLKKISGLEKYFLLGFLDGDGYVKYCLQFSGSYDFDWSNLIAYFRGIGISKYVIRRYISKLNHKSSSLTLLAKERNILLKIIYSPIGLQRKGERIRKILKINLQEIN